MEEARKNPTDGSAGRVYLNVRSLLGKDDVRTERPVIVGEGQRGSGDDYIREGVVGVGDAVKGVPNGENFADAPGHMVIVGISGSRGGIRVIGHIVPADKHQLVVGIIR